MTLNEYQEAALQTAVYPGRGHDLSYPVLGLIGEAGELANQLKKVLRDDDGVLSRERRGKMLDELGDVLWYVAAVAHELGMDLAGVAVRNIVKLSARADAGTIKGDARGEV